MRFPIKYTGPSDVSAEEYENDGRSAATAPQQPALEGDPGSHSRRRVLKIVGAVGLSASMAGYVSTDDESYPKIESLEITDNSNPPWVWWYNTDWEVSSGDADLEFVKIELLDGRTAVDVDVDESVAGSTASGELRVRTRDDVEADYVRFTVVDEDGRVYGRMIDVEDVEDEDDEDESDEDNGDEDESDEDNGDEDGSDEDNGDEDAVEGEDESDGDDEDEDDGMPGPGLFATLASIGGASYLLARLRRDDAE